MIKSDWLDIATAPRDGTTILGYYGPGEIIEIRWSEERRRAGVLDPGWEDVHNELYIDSPPLWGHGTVTC